MDNFPTRERLILFCSLREQRNHQVVVVHAFILVLRRQRHVDLKEFEARASLRTARVKRETLS